MKVSKMYVDINFDKNTAKFKQNFWKTKKLTFLVFNWVLCVLFTLAENKIVYRSLTLGSSFSGWLDTYFRKSQDSRFSQIER